jgi:hypothetical protein
MTLPRIIPCPVCHASLRAEITACPKCGCTVHAEVRLQAEVTGAGLQLRVQLPEFLRDVTVDEDDPLRAVKLVRETNEFLRGLKGETHPPARDQS